jgi:hypothetical protein
MIKARGKAGGSAVSRGGYASRRLRERYENCHERAAGAHEPFASYYLYLCTRKLRLIRFADAIDTKGLGMYMEHVARTLFEMIGPAGWGSTAGRSRALAHVSVGGETMTAAPADCFTLGIEGHSEINRSVILGETVSERIPRLDIEFVIGLGEWEMLERRDDALDMLMQAVDLAVPVHMNFKMFFRIHQDEGVFTLPPAGGHVDSGSVPVLGVNSILGGA